MKSIRKALFFMSALTALGAQAAPLFNLFELGVVEGQNAYYDQIAEQNIRTSMANEQGTLAMMSLKAADNPQLAYMLEIYADEAAYQIHRNSPQYQKFAQAAPQILTAHKVRTALDPQFLADKPLPMGKKLQVNLVRVTVKPEQNAAFKAIVLEEMAQSIKAETGVLAMYAGSVQNSPNQWVFLEVFTDDNSHLAQYFVQTAEMLEQKTFVPVQASELGNQGKLRFSVK